MRKLLLILAFSVHGLAHASIEERVEPFLGKWRAVNCFNIRLKKAGSPGTIQYGRPRSRLADDEGEYFLIEYKNNGVAFTGAVDLSRQIPENIEITHLNEGEVEIERYAGEENMPPTEWMEYKTVNSRIKKNAISSVQKYYSETSYGFPFQFSDSDKENRKIKLTEDGGLSSMIEYPSFQSTQCDFVR